MPRSVGGPFGPARREGTMRVMAAAVTAAALAAVMMPAATAARADDAEVERLVRQHVQPMLIAARGMAGARQHPRPRPFFQHGLGHTGRPEAIPPPSLFSPPPPRPRS